MSRVSLSCRTTHQLDKYRPIASYLTCTSSFGNSADVRDHISHVYDKIDRM